MIYNWDIRKNTSRTLDLKGLKFASYGLKDTQIYKEMTIVKRIYWQSIPAAAEETTKRSSNNIITLQDVIKHRPHRILQLRKSKRSKYMYHSILRIRNINTDTLLTRLAQLFWHNFYCFRWFFSFKLSLNITVTVSIKNNIKFWQIKCICLYSELVTVILSY